MPGLRVTDELLRDVTDEVYGPRPAHAPSDLWVDHFDADWSYVRASYRDEFCATCARRLFAVVAKLRKASGNEPSVTVCVYMGGDRELPERRHDALQARLRWAGGRQP